MNTTHRPTRPASLRKTIEVIEVIDMDPNQMAAGAMTSHPIDQPFFSDPRFNQPLWLDEKLPTGQINDIFIEVCPNIDNETFSWNLTTHDRTGGVRWELVMPYELDNASMRNPLLVYEDGVAHAIKLIKEEIEADRRQNQLAVDCWEQRVAVTTPEVEPTGPYTSACRLPAGHTSDCMRQDGTRFVPHAPHIDKVHVPCTHYHPCNCCPVHGENCKIVPEQTGSNSGFAGEGFSWATWECGHTEAGGGEYYDA